MRHRNQEKCIWIASLILSLAVLGVTVAGALYAKGAYEQARRQADIAQNALIESDHPFLNVKITNKEPIEKDGQIYPQVRFEIENSGGKTAAVDFAQFGIVSDPRQAVTSFGLDCIVLTARRVIAPSGNISDDCVSKVAFPAAASPLLFAGVFTYRNQIGTRWRQQVEYFRDSSGNWSESGSLAGNTETRIGPDGNPIKSDLPN